MDTLTAKQKRFCEEYAICLEGKKSYKEAYGDVKDSTAEVNSSKLLKDNRIIEYLNYLMNGDREKRIASINEIMEFHSDVVRNEYEKLGYRKPIFMKDRISSAIELAKRHELVEDRNSGADKSVTVKVVRASDRAKK